MTKTNLLHFRSLALRIFSLSLITFLASPSLIFVTKSYAQNSSSNLEAINQQDWITRQQQNSLEEKKRNFEFENILKERKRKLDEANSRDLQASVSGGMNKCIFVESITFLDAQSLSNLRKKRLASPFIGKCIDADLLAELIKKVSEFYHQNGYTTTQILIPNQNLQSGIIKLQIIEGRIEKITLKTTSKQENQDTAAKVKNLKKKNFKLNNSSDHFFTGENSIEKSISGGSIKSETLTKEHDFESLIDKMQKFSAFGNLSGEVLNLNDINQGIYQLNRLQSNSAVMKIKPGNEIGKSIIEIENSKKFPAKLTLSKDNLGNQFTGIQRTNFSSNFDNLLFLNDNLNLNYSTNLHDQNKVKDIKSFSGSLSLPFKYNTFSYDYSHSMFRGQNSGSNGTSIMTGFSQSSKITFDRVFISNTKIRLSSNASLVNKSSGSYLNGEKITTSQRRLSILNLGFSASSSISDTANFYFSPSFVKGLRILDSEKDRPYSSNTTPKAQFEAVKLYSNFSKKLTIPKINSQFSFVSEINAQHSKKTLFGSEQFSVGGYYSVRGFRENYINGDSGYNFRNKISMNFGSLLLPIIKNSAENNREKKSGYWEKNLAHLNKISLEPFYDYGYAKNNYVDDGRGGRMSGAGMKTIFSSIYFNASATYSWALSRSKMISSPIKENHMLYFELSASCC